MRLMLGMAAIASASALTAAMAPSIAPQTAAAPGDGVTSAAALPGEPTPGEQAPVRKVTQFVILGPGQTAPPGAATQAQPQPTPLVKTKVIARTRQSGQP